MAAPEPTSAGRRGPEPQGTWQRRSPSQPGGEVWSHMTCGSAGAHLSREVRSEAIGHMAIGAHVSQEARSGCIGHVAACGCTPCYFS
jgi:hypothetical protein